MTLEPDQRRKLRKPLAAAAVVLLHGLAFVLMARSTSAPIPIGDPPILVELVAPPEPPEPEPEPEPAVEVGGGAPAAPSRVHRPPEPRPTTSPVVAPPEPAPEPEIVVGASPEPGPTPGQGQGGEGTGTGGGVGSGSGPGSGTVRARLIAAPSGRELSRLHPDGPGATRPGRASVTCRIRLDTRLDNCRVTSESPPGAGFGEAALRAAALYRFQPPTRDGRPETGEIVLQPEFGRPRR